jgi:uncharacterized protein (TIGR02246 family)
LEDVTMKSMRWISCAGLGLALVGGFVALRPATGGGTDEADVRKQCNALVTAWNKHDAKAMAAVFAEDGDAVDPGGKRAEGRAQVEKMFADMHGPTGPFRESTLEVKDEPIRFPTADIAVSDADVVVTGAYGPDGSKAGPMSLIVTDVWRKTGGTWLVYACRPHMKAPAQ